MEGKRRKERRKRKRGVERKEEEEKGKKRWRRRSEGEEREEEKEVGGKKEEKGEIKFGRPKQTLDCKEKPRCAPLPSQFLCVTSFLLPALIPRRLGSLCCLWQNKQ